jgi:hypothetical protein
MPGESCVRNCAPDPVSFDAEPSRMWIPPESTKDESS